MSVKITSCGIKSEQLVSLRKACQNLCHYNIQSFHPVLNTCPTLFSPNSNFSNCPALCSSTAFFTTVPVIVKCVDHYRAVECVKFCVIILIFMFKSYPTYLCEVNSAVPVILRGLENVLKLNVHVKACCEKLTVLSNKTELN